MANTFNIGSDNHNELPTSINSPSFTDLSNHNVEHINGNVPKYESKVRFVAANGNNNLNGNNLNNHVIIKNGNINKLLISNEMYSFLFCFY